MGQIPAQHPSVVLRSHFNLVRSLLILAMVALLAFAAAVVILANDDDQLSSATKATPGESINYGGFNSATGRPDTAPALQQQSQTPGTRYDGGPDEGTRGATSFAPQTAPGARYDGGPEEGSRGPQQPQPNNRAGGPTLIPQGPGAR